MMSFQPVCTLPADGVSYVAAANTRSTLRILLECAVIIVLSTWNVQYPRVWMVFSPRTPLQRFNCMKRDLLNNVIAMVWTMIFPEILAAQTLWQRFQATYATRILLQQPCMEVPKVKWTLQHTNLADEGGVAIRFMNNATYLSATIIDASTSPIPGNTNATHQPADLESIISGISDSFSPFAHHVKLAESWYGEADWQLDDYNNRMVTKVMSRPDTWLAGNIKNWPSDEPFSHRRDKIPETHRRHLDALRGQIWYVNTRQIWTLLRCGVLPTTPQIKEPQINGITKSKLVAKLISLYKFVDLGLKLCLRMNANLPVSPLEYATLALAFCAITVYGIQWSKPQQVAIPHVIPVYEAPPEGVMTEVASLADRQHGANIPIWGPFDEAQSVVHSFKDIFHLGSALVGSCFGAIHCLAWNFQFPTTIERTLWRYAAIVSIVCPWCVYGVNASRRWPAVSRALDKLDLKLSIGPIPIEVQVGFAICFLVRIFVIVEMFRSLFYMPPGAYVATPFFNLG